METEEKESPKGKPAAKPLHADHRARMQERVRRDGIESLAEHEVLEYLLFFAIPRQDTNALAHRLIEQFGSYCNVLEAEEKELAQVPGIGPGSARLLHSVLQFSRYYSINRRKKRPALKSAQQRMEYAEPLFLGLQEEALYLIVLDDKFVPLRDVKINQGIPNKVSVDVSKVARAAVTAGGSCAFLAHNHPHGIALPSYADITTTGVLAKALGILGVDLLDHIIVGDEESTSLLQTGRMPLYDPLRGEVQYK